MEPRANACLLQRKMHHRQAFCPAWLLKNPKTARWCPLDWKGTTTTLYWNDGRHTQQFRIRAPCCMCDAGPSQKVPTVAVAMTSTPGLRLSHLRSLWVVWLRAARSVWVAGRMEALECPFALYPPRDRPLLTLRTLHQQHGLASANQSRLILTIRELAPAAHAFTLSTGRLKAEANFPTHTPGDASLSPCPSSHCKYMCSRSELQRRKGLRWMHLCCAGVACLWTPLTRDTCQAVG